MQTTYIGGEKVIQRGSRVFRYCDESCEHALNAEWADRVLSSPAVTFPNGRNSHEVAGAMLDKSEDGLIDYLLVTA